MPSAITSTLKRFTHALREFTVGQRTIAIIGLAVLVVGAIGLTAWLSKPSYAPLFTSLSASDAGSITQLLHTDGVPYQLSDGGSTILVPQEQVDAERLKAASAGLPSLSQDGYGLLDNLGVTASAFQQTTTYQRALQGELANTIEAMNGVETASVKLAIPDQTVFTSQQTPTTASVFVHTQGNGSLSGSQVSAITHLVAASVDNLKPTNVSVISADGTLLSGSGAASSDKSASASTYEARTQAAIQSMLDQVLGAGNSTVVVAADLSADSAKQVSQTYTAPTNAPVINEQSSSQVYSGDGGSSSTATGVLGPDNIAVPSGTSTNGSYNSTSTTKNNAINQTTETRTIPAGAVNRQTISVAVNKSAAKGVTASKIQKLVDAAAGVNAKRGDMVDVQLVSFSKAGAVAAQSALGAQSGAEMQNNIVKIATTAVTVFGILLGLFLLLRFLTRAAKKREGSSAPLDLSELDLLGTGPSELETHTFPMESLPAAPEPLPLEPAPDQPEFARMRASIDRLAGTNPQRTAEYLRSLMDEKQSV
jgi:flagellar M-ring protein FliF